jgi:S1-C subfamily serine protease
MRRYFILTIAGGLLGTTVAWQVPPTFDQGSFAPAAAYAQLLARAQSNPLVPDDPAIQLTPEEQANIRVYEVASRSVVNINTEVVSYDRFFLLPTPGQGSGSGSLLDRQGHVLTNYHVVEDARQIEVTLHNGKSYPAKLVGFDKAYDVAVLKIDAPSEEIVPISLGKSDHLKVGQRVYALGNPFGLEGTLTTGIISSLNRTLPSRIGDRELNSMIQTDAAMNPGNSGGPLLDTSGQMIGMNMAIATKTGQNAGVGFAIPINRIRRSVSQLLEYGKVIRADIGISYVMETDEGLQIVKTNRGGPAENAGLRGWQNVRQETRRGPIVYTTERTDKSQADYILAVDGVEVFKGSQFQEKIEEHQPGETIVLRIRRDGREIDVPVTLGSA